MESFEKLAQKKKIDVSLVGIDIDKTAINNSKRCKFIHTDALYPLGNSNPTNGWNALIRKYMPNGIDLIVSNPPWGANMDHYVSLPRDFKTATGQYDIYDLFIETIVANLKQDGVYGIIVPDSIYCQEHKKVREILLTNTTIKGIVRLGEGFFPDVNFAVSIIYGIKKTSTKYDILCSHISNSEKKTILSGKADIYTVVRKKAIQVPAMQMITTDYSFTVDVSKVDLPIIQKLNKCDTVSTYTSCQRGVELSKKGVVIQCPNVKMVSYA